MKKLLVAALIAACTVAPVVAQDSAPVEPANTGTIEGNDPEALKLVTDCNARKFETVVEREEDGQKHSSKVKLCGKQGQTDAEWAATLKDAASKIEENEKMPQAAKDQLIAALNAEIAKIESAAPSSPPVAQSQPEAVAPPMATPVVAALPPAPKTVPVAKKPKLTIKCLSPGEKDGGSSCAKLDRATVLAIHAEADLAPGTSLRFLRRGDARGTVAVAPMRQGEMVRSKLPSELCSGVASSKVEIQVMAATQVVDTYGPYSLRC